MVRSRIKCELVRQCKLIKLIKYCAIMINVDSRKYGNSQLYTTRLNDKDERSRIYVSPSGGAIYRRLRTLKVSSLSLRYHHRER